MAAESSVVVAADALIPSRVTGSLRYAVEDAARFAQMSEFLRRHMREAVGSAIDTRVLTDSTNGLGSISEPNDPAAVSDYDTYVGSVTGRVDGRRAAVPAEVRLVVGGMTFAHMAGQYRTTASESSAYDRLRLISGGVRVHSDIPAHLRTIRKPTPLLGRPTFRAWLRCGTGLVSLWIPSPTSTRVK